MSRRSLFASSADDEVSLDPWEGATNAIRDVLEERGQKRQQVQTSRLTLRAWADLVPEQRGPLDFRKFAWQEELYAANATNDREMVFQKATQIGMSTQSLRWALFHADVMQRVVLYTFPTDDELTEFSRQRIGPVIRSSAHLMARMKAGAVNNVSQKEIGSGGWIYFRGTNKPIDSIDADVIVFDEYDTSDQANIADSEYRVTGPQSAGLIRRLGVPSIPEFGISELYADSDQRVWVVKCTGCREQNPMRGFEAFDANVDEDAVALVCRKCRKPIDVRVGEWVAKYPNREVRGYHIPKLLIPERRVLAGVIKRSKRTKDYEKVAFHTRDLGEPYAPAEGRLSREQVEANVRPEFRLLDPWGAIPGTHAVRTMGVDVASVRALNVVIEEEVDHTKHTIGRKLWVGEVEDDPSRGSAFVQIVRLMNVFGINMAGIDDGPEGRFSQAFCGRFPGRAYRVSFFSPGPQQKKTPEPWMVDDQAQFVSLWRTRAYDATFERFRMQHALLPPLETLPADYASHLGNLYRQKTEIRRKDQHGQMVGTGAVRVDYVKTGPEDYGQAEAYNLAAIELYHRNRALGLVASQGAVPLADVDPYAADHDGAQGGEPMYRGGFD